MFIKAPPQGCLQQPWKLERLQLLDIILFFGGWGGTVAVIPAHMLAGILQPGGK